MSSARLTLKKWPSTTGSESLLPGWVDAPPVAAELASTLGSPPVALAQSAVSSIAAPPVAAPLPQPVGTNDGGEGAAIKTVDAKMLQVLVPMSDGTSVSLRHSFSEQHTISWSALPGPDGGLPAGSCNLYQYPSVRLAGSATDIALEGAPLDRLRALVLGLCVSSGGRVGASGGARTDPASVPDTSGACVLHGLLIANTDEALSVALDVMSRRPELLTQAHAAGPFAGENHLHVLAVNQRQAASLTLLELAASALDDDGIRTLLQSHALGAFFQAQPMRSYGGSPVAYLASFRATQVLGFVFEQPRLRAHAGLNDVTCPFSGYTALHAAVANARPEAYDQLVACGADPTRPTVATDKSPLRLTAVQLACRLGHQRMLEHILMSRWQVQWRWGPVISYKLRLEEIDSASGSMYDVMEIVLMPDAPKATQEMLLDDFMGGFLFTLFQQKWSRFARRQHIVFRCLDGATLLLLLALGVSLKAHPLTADRTYLPLAAVACLAVQLTYELLKVGCSRRRAANIVKGTRYLRRLTMLLVGALACGVVLLSPHAPAPNGAGDAPAWGLLAVATFLHFAHFISTLFVAHPNWGIFALVVDKLLATDVRVFLTFYFLYLSCHWAAMYMTYPRAGTGVLTFVPEFNGLVSSFEAMVNLGIAGKHFDINFWTAEAAELDAAEWGALVVFTIFYYQAMLILVILLLRMLMAMLTATFAKVRTDATLEWRLQFARHVVQYELIAMRTGIDTYAGEKIGDEWYYVFRAYKDIDDDAPPTAAGAPASAAKPSSNGALQSKLTPNLPLSSSKSKERITMVKENTRARER